MKKVFIDGSAGTTGLRIFDRLQARSDIQLLTLPEAERKDEGRRRQLLNEADAAFLCLPDAAAEEAASWVENPDTVVLDTSTAHRTAPGWCYGFPELSALQEARIRQARRIAVPGFVAARLRHDQRERAELLLPARQVLAPRCALERERPIRAMRARSSVSVVPRLAATSR